MSVWFYKVTAGIERDEKLALEGDTDSVRRLAWRALEYARSLHGVTRKDPDNYTLQVGPANSSTGGKGYEWYDIDQGTRDFCIGAAKGHTDWGKSRIVCGDVIVWPEESWGEEAKLAFEDPPDVT